MAANLQPLFLGTPFLSQASLTTANTARDGTGTIVSVFTAGANGSRPGAVKACGIGANTAGLVSFFINNSVAWFYWTSLVVVATTPSATVRPWEDYIDPEELEQLVLQSGWKIGAAPTQTENFNVFAYAGSY